MDHAASAITGVARPIEVYSHCCVGLRNHMSTAVPTWAVKCRTCFASVRRSIDDRMRT